MPVALMESDLVDTEARVLLNELIDEYRKDLKTHDVTIGLLFAVPDKVGMPAIKHRGRRCAGSCKVNAYKDRVEGKPDATITLDGDRWAGWSRTRRLALLHHELNHIAYFDGEKFDQAGRPAIKSRYGDWEFDGFLDVLAIYGSDSFEASNFQRLHEATRQMKLPFTIAAPIAVDAPATDQPPGLVDTPGAVTGCLANTVQEVNPEAWLAPAEPEPEPAKKPKRASKPKATKAKQARA